MRKVIENKNIIVVDVINSDSAVCYEAIIETPRPSRSAARKGDRSPGGKSPVRDPLPDEKVILLSEKSPALCDKAADKPPPPPPGRSAAVIELEHLEREPRVRRSSVESTRSRSRSPSSRWQVGMQNDEQSLERQVIDELERKLQERVQLTSAPVEAEKAKSPETSQGKDVVREIPRTVSREFTDRSSKRSSRADDFDDKAISTLGDEASTIKKELSAGSKISWVPSREETEEKRSSESECLPDSPVLSVGRSDSTTGRRHSAGATSGNAKPRPWTQFAEEALNSPQKEQKIKSSEASPPPLPPRGAVAHAPPTTNWVNFDEAPERRRVPKRITTLPLRHSTTTTSTAQPTTAPVVYSYVNPEECSCECHESSDGHRIANSQQCYGKDSDPCTFKKTPRTDNKRYRT
ncbi:unnamed protein product [Nesidiocoris tenuis]|uniref:Uncharacterized protein n=1 Tax=Nesidiocoris tenuis TaxID=355587 RepID=A0A6H5FXQ1_9HEMI|nr:unnamed protein product [Nesidiocoris tenuis]